jgi:hypothetical protein
MVAFGRAPVPMRFPRIRPLALIENTFNEAFPIILLMFCMPAIVAIVLKRQIG